MESKNTKTKLFLPQSSNIFCTSSLRIESVYEFFDMTTVNENRGGQFVSVFQASAKINIYHV